MNNEKKEKKKYYARLFGFRRAVPVILVALSIFIAICFFTDGAGLLGSGVSAFLKGLFSFGAYFIPPLLILHAVFYAGDYVKSLTISRAIFSFITILIVSCIEYIICFWSEPVFAPGEFYLQQSAGGFLGSMVAYGLARVLGPVGLIILSVALIAVYVTYFFANGNSVASRSVMKVFSAIGGFFTSIVKKRKAAKAEKEAAKAENERIAEEKRSAELMADSFFAMDENVSELKIEQLGISEKNEAAEAPAVEEPKKAEPEPTPEVKRAERPKRVLNLDYGLDLSQRGEDKPSDARSAEQKVAEPPRASRIGAAYGLDDSADNVFTKDFDPFDFATAEKIAHRPSSRVKPKENSGISEVATPLSAVTEEDISLLRQKQEEDRRRREFEEKKKRILENMSSRSTSASAPTNTYSAPAAQPAANAPVSTYSAPAAQPVASAPASTYSAPAAQPEANAPASTYSAPAAQPAASAPASTYSAPAAQPAANAPASTYSAPAAQPAASAPASTYSAPAAESEDRSSAHKSVEYNISGEEQHSGGEPAMGSTVTFVFDKSEHYPDETQRIAAEVAQMLEKNVTGYTRSANRSFTYTKISEASNAPAQKHENETAFTIDTAKGSDGAASGISASYMSHDSLEAERVTEPSAIRTFPQSYAPTQSETRYSAAEDGEARLGIVTEFTTGEREAPSAQSFNEYKAPEITSHTAAQGTEEIRIERTMIEPTVTPDPAVITERDRRFTVIDEDMQPENEADDSSSKESESANGSESATLLDFGDSEEDELSVPDVSDDISAIFDAEDEDDEDVAPEAPDEDEDSEIEEIPPEEQNPEILKQRQLFPFLDNAPKAESTVPEDESGEAEDYIPDDDEDEPPFDIPEQKPAAGAPEKGVALVTEKDAKKSAPKAPSYKDFKFPPIELLGINADAADENVQLEIQENADRLIDTLSSFNVTASIKGVDRGPRITRYEVVPAKGVKVSSIMNLQDDIALSLAADGIRMEAPIPGKSAVGVEIPNKHDTTVRLRELIETEDFRSMKSKTSICIGKDVAGQPVINDIAKMPHLLIAGATGMGKSVCINSLLISILYKARPDEVKLIMIDPKQVEFTMYNGIPHLLIPVVSDAKQAAGALMWAVDEMEKRFTQLNSACVRNIDGYNEKVAEDPSLGEPMSKIIIVIDEFADLMLQVKDPVENLVMRIAQKARAAGIHLIIGTQRPSTNVITGTIKANIPSRMSCKVASNVDSRTVLDTVGAEKLLNKGDMLFAYAGAIKPLRVQGAFVSDGEVQNIMNHLKQFSTGADYDEAVMEEIKRAADKCSKKGSGGGDDERDGDDSSGEGFLNDRQFLEAVEVAVNSGKISTSLLQRKISVGYGKAAKFIDVMCDMGIVSEPNGSKAREVLITPDEWREKLARTQYD